MDSKLGEKSGKTLPVSNNTNAPKKAETDRSKNPFISSASPETMLEKGLVSFSASFCSLPRKVKFFAVRICPDDDDDNDDDDAAKLVPI